MSELLTRIFDHAIKQPKSTALICPERTVSYAKLAELVDKTAVWLRTNNVRTLGLHCDNKLEWVTADLAAIQLGIPVIPIPGFFSEDQVNHLISDSGVDAILADSIQRYRCEIGQIHHNDNEKLSLRQLKNSGPTQKHGYAKITYTSGSTGRPKGVCLSQSTIESVVEALSDRLSDTTMERHLCMLPFATLLENIAGLYLAFWNGGSAVIDCPSRFGLRSNNDFSAKCFFSAIASQQVNSAILLPQMLKAIVQEAQRRQTNAEEAEYQTFSSLSFLAVGGGKTPTKVIEQAHQLGLPVYEGYGLSETASVLCINTPSHNRTGSVGQLLDHARMSFAKDGEVVVSKPIMEGYLHEERKTEFVSTGDIGHIDEDGFVFINGRKKNCLISGFGRNISPEWVESHFLGEPEIHQLAIFGEAQSHLSAVVVSRSQSDSDRMAQLIETRNASLPD